MKRIALMTLGMLFLTSTLSFSQNNNALGLRLGGGNTVGAEISFQTPFQNNRAELDLGFGGNSNWDYWNLAGIYQWVMPIDNAFYWYLGLGPSIGSWSYVGHYPDGNDEGISLALALNAGVEYTFSEVPIQLSIDTRPELGIINNGNRSRFGLAFSVRYVF